METKQTPLPFEAPYSEIVTFGAQDIITISDPAQTQYITNSFDI